MGASTGKTKALCGVERLSGGYVELWGSERGIDGVKIRRFY